jgi:hypothetical protein
MSLGLLNLADGTDCPETPVTFNLCCIKSPNSEDLICTIELTYTAVSLARTINMQQHWHWLSERIEWRCLESPLSASCHRWLTMSSTAAAWTAAKKHFLQSCWKVPRLAFTARPSRNLPTGQSQVRYYQVIAACKPRYVCGPPAARNSFRKYLIYAPPSESRTTVFVYYWRTVKLGEQ